MAQPATKRRKISCVKASKIADLTWEWHKSTFTHLYIHQNKTVAEIQKFMLDNHNFSANLQQYQKRFSHWYLTKNISPNDWLALSQQLKRYCITLDFFHPRDGTADIAFNSQVLGFDKVKKAIYRYDTSLLNTHQASRDSFLNPVRKLQSMLRSIIVRCVINGGDGLRYRIPIKLIDLLFTVSNSRGLSSNSADYRAWSLRRRSDECLIAFPTDEGQDVFVACIESISGRKADTMSPRRLDSEQLNRRWTAFLKDEAVSSRRKWSFVPEVTLENPYILDSDITTGVLMVTLMHCALFSPKSTLGILTVSEVVQISGLLSNALTSLYNELLEILLFAAVSEGEAAYCERLMATNVNLNAIQPGWRFEHFVCFGKTPLQVSLTFDDSSHSSSKQRISMMLLQAGADPSLCGEHGRGQPPHTFCCRKSPLYLALRQTPSILRSMLDLWPCTLANFDLTTATLNIGSTDILSTLLERGFSPEGRSPFILESVYVCPLQAALRCQKRSMALRLLECINSSIGCSTHRLQQLQIALTEDDGSRYHYADFAFGTPLTYAIESHFFDIAHELLMKGASPNESYLDYLSTDFCRRLEVLSDLKSIKNYVCATSASPLQAAVFRKDVDAVEFSLRIGADPNFLYAGGLSALAIAVLSPNETIIELLLGRNASVFLEDLRVFVGIARNVRNACECSEDCRLIEESSCILADGAIYALNNIIKTLGLKDSEGKMNGAVKRRYHATDAQFRVLRQDVGPIIARFIDRWQDTCSYVHQASDQLRDEPFRGI